MVRYKVTGEHLHKGRVGEVRGSATALQRHYRKKGYSHSTPVPGAYVKFPDVSVPVVVPLSMCEAVA
jgi:hypothetical protein